jgi:hypothetical protein
MKKFAIALLSAGLLISSGLQAQENAGGADGSIWASGEMKKEAIIMGTVVAGLVVAAVANSNGRAKPGPVTPTCPVGQELVGGVCVPKPPVYTCENDDQLVDGVCIGNSTTVTVSGTTTITIPVTFTYLPTIS